MWSRGKRTCVQVHVSWAPTDDEALAIAHDQWRTLFGSELAWNLEFPSQFDAAARTIRAEDVREVVLISSDLERHVAWLQEIAELGVDEISIHHVGQEQSPFIDAFGERVLPKLMT
jgi:alkanesulfonate monooxygenase SsuD/methylene tetrahydromethanopterin reductase-like flavin-dependent oxidoreductase (luciferase family)